MEFEINLLFPIIIVILIIIIWYQYYDTKKQAYESIMGEWTATEEYLLESEATSYYLLLNDKQLWIILVNQNGLAINEGVAWNPKLISYSLNEIIYEQKLKNMTGLPEKITIKYNPLMGRLSMSNGGISYGVFFRY